MSLKENKNKNRLRNFIWIIAGILLFILGVWATTTITDTEVTTTGNVTSSHVCNSTSCYELIDFLTMGTGNASWNQSGANELYAGIEWDYNETDASTSYTNATNSSLAVWIDSLFLKISDVIEMVGNWSQGETHYYNKSQVDTNLSLYILDSSLPLENQTISHCSNITGNTTDLCTITPGGANQSAYTNCTGSDLFLGNGSCWSSIYNYNMSVDLGWVDDGELWDAVFNASFEDKDISGSGANQSAYTNCTGSDLFLGNGSCWIDPYLYNQTDAATSYTNATNSSLAVWIDSLFLRISNVIEMVGNWSQGETHYYNKSQVDSNFSLYTPLTSLWDATFNNSFDDRDSDTIFDNTNVLYLNNTDLNITINDITSNLTEDNVEAYIFDNDNTANLNISHYNLTSIDCLTFQSGGKICSE